MSVKTKAPIEEYLSLPEGHPAELIKGEIVLSPSPSVIHQEIAGKVFWNLKKVVDELKIGKVFFELDVHFDEENVLRPDIIFITKERRSIIKENWIEGAPDIVFEITSPSTISRDAIEKREIYERFGVKEYRIIDLQAKEVFVLLNKNGKFGLACKGKKCSSKVIDEFEWGFEE